MQRTPLGEIACSIARTFDVLGEPWTALILRDVYVGITRFDAIQRDLELSRKVLAGRLQTLVDGGALERRAYQHNPPRYDYVLTRMGQELVVVLLAAMAWGDRWANDGGAPVVLHHGPCGQDTHPQVTCSACGGLIHTHDITPRAGPGARPGRATTAIGVAVTQRPARQATEHHRGRH